MDSSHLPSLCMTNKEVSRHQVFVDVVMLDQAKKLEVVKILLINMVQVCSDFRHSQVKLKRKKMRNSIEQLQLRRVAYFVHLALMILENVMPAQMDRVY